MKKNFHLMISKKILINIECRKDIISNIGNCIIKKKEYRKIILKIPLKNGKYPTISFILDKKKRDAKLIIAEVKKIIDYLNEENNTLKTKIKFIENNAILNVNVKRNNEIKQYTFKYLDILSTLIQKFRESVKNMERSIHLLYKNKIIYIEFIDL